MGVIGYSLRYVKFRMPIRYLSIRCPVGILVMLMGPFML